MYGVCVCVCVCTHINVLSVGSLCYSTYINGTGWLWVSIVTTQPVGNSLYVVVVCPGVQQASWSPGFGGFFWLPLPPCPGLPCLTSQGSGNLNSGPQARAASAFPLSRLSPQPSLCKTLLNVLFYKAVFITVSLLISSLIYNCCLLSFL